MVVAVLLTTGAAGAAEPLPPAAEPVLLSVTGAIDATNSPGEARFDRTMLEGLGRGVIRTSTPWTEGVRLFEGVPLRRVLDRVGARGTRLHATALNAYEVTLPIADLAYDPLLAMRMDGERLFARGKGPLWIVYPRDQNALLQNERFDQRWVWQLVRLHVE